MSFLKKTLVAATMIFAFIITPATQAETIVLDFEALPGPLAPIPAGYAGFASWGSPTSCSMWPARTLAAADRFGLRVPSDVD